MADRTSLGGFDFSFDLSMDPTGNAMAMPQSEPDQSELFLTNTEGRTEFLAPDPDKVPVIENAVKQDSAEYAKRPAIERTRELFSQMRPQRTVLLGIINAAHEPLSMDDVHKVTENLQQKKFSVYTPSNLCTMLEIAGAINRVTADGEPYALHASKPDIVIEDGEEYYVPTTPEKVHWLATEAGANAAVEDNPDERLQELFESETDLLPIYKRVLTTAKATDGVEMDELSVQVDGNPLISTPRRFYVQHFVEALERCDALVWNAQAWTITDMGERALELLSDVIDDYEPPADAVPLRAMPTETDGINW